MRGCSWIIRKELSPQCLVTGLAWLPPPPFWLQRPHPEYHLVLSFLEASVFCQGAGGLRKPHGSPWDLPRRDHCSRGVRASVPIPAPQGQLPRLAPHLLFRNKLHLPENMTVQLEACQNSHFAECVLFWTSSLLRSRNWKLLSICKGGSTLEVGWLFMKLGGGSLAARSANWER